MCVYVPHLLRVCVERRRYRRGSGCFKDKERVIYRNTIGLDRREREGLLTLNMERAIRGGFAVC